MIELYKGGGAVGSCTSQHRSELGLNQTRLSHTEAEEGSEDVITVEPMADFPLCKLKRLLRQWEEIRFIELEEEIVSRAFEFSHGAVIEFLKQLANGRLISSMEKKVLLRSAAMIHQVQQPGRPERLQTAKSRYAGPVCCNNRFGDGPSRKRPG